MASGTLLQEVHECLKREGILSSGLVIGIDFSGNNAIAGENSFFGEHLHTCREGSLNPYEEVTRTFVNALQPASNEIYSYRLGYEKRSPLQPFFRNGRPARDYAEFIKTYRKFNSEAISLSPFVDSETFSSMVNTALKIVRSNNNKYRILVLVLSSLRTAPRAEDTIQTIKQAAESGIPLSIIVVGVGDGPWEHMEYVRESLIESRHYNFQFINFTEISSQAPPMDDSREALLATTALMGCVQHHEQLINRNKLRLPPRNLNGSHKAPASSRSQSLLRERSQGGPELEVSRMEILPVEENICPITFEVMEDPVLAADGFIYEREAIEMWLKKSNTSPMTNLPLRNKILTTAPAAKRRDATKELASSSSNESYGRSYLGKDLLLSRREKGRPYLI